MSQAAIQRATVPDCLVTVYCSTNVRDYRGVGVVVGPRTVLTIGHLLKTGREGAPRIMVDDHPRRLFRAEVLLRVPTSRRLASKLQGRDRELGGDAGKDDVVWLNLPSDLGRLSRTRQFFEDQIAVFGEGEPTLILQPSGLTKYPAETGPGSSGSPLFNERGELVGLHAGRGGWPPECCAPVYSPVKKEAESEAPRRVALVGGGAGDRGALRARDRRRPAAGGVQVTLEERMGWYFRSRRKALGLKQSTVAKALGITQGSYSRIESGESEITVGRLVAVCAALDISPCVLLDRSLLRATQ